MTTKQTTGSKATITSSLQDDVVTYEERGNLVAEFKISGNHVRAIGFAASLVKGLRKGSRITVVGHTVTRQWLSRDGQFGEVVLKSRSQMGFINATRITVLR